MKNAILFLIILFQAPYASSNFSVKFNSNNCPTLGRQSATSHITQSFISIRRHQQQSSCDDYDTGEERIFEKDDRVAGLGGYVVKKNPDGSYTASVALRFSPEEDYDGSVSYHRVHQHYLQKMRNCMRQFSPYMLGPSGEKLNIEVLDMNTQNISREAQHSISIQSSRGRSTGVSYESDINCEVMTHEIFHLLGLKDEYPEMHAGHFVNPRDGHIRSYDPNYPRYNFDCRVTQENSVMSHHWDRFDSVNNRTQASLLDPIHFDAILYGQCDSREDLNLFRQCSELAYQNSQNNRNCHVLRRQCEAQDILGRHRQQNNQNRQDEQNDRLGQSQNYNKNNQIGSTNNRKSQRPFIELSTSLNLTPEEERALTRQISNLSPENARSAVQFLESSRQPPSNLNAERRQRWRENIKNRIRQIQRRNYNNTRPLLPSDDKISKQIQKGYNDLQSKKRQERVNLPDIPDEQENDRLDQEQNNNLQNNKNEIKKNSRNQRPFIELSTSLNLTPEEEKALTRQINNLSPENARSAIQFLESSRQPPSNLNAERRQRWTENIENRLRQLQRRFSYLQSRNQQEINNRQPSNRQRQQNTNLNPKQSNNQNKIVTSRPTRRFIDSLTDTNLTPTEKRVVNNQIDNLNIRQVEIATQFLKTRRNNSNLTSEERENIENRIRQVQGRRNELQPRNQREISTRQLTTPPNRQRQQNTRLNQKQNNNQSRSTTNRPTRRFIDSLTNPNLNPSEERAVTNQIDNLNIRQVRIAIQVLKTRQNDPNLTPEERANIESRMRKVQRRHNALQ